MTWPLGHTVSSFSSSTQAKPQILESLVLPHGAWLACSPLLLLRPCQHGVKVLVVIIITVTRGQPRPVFLSFQGSQDPERDKEA